MLGGCVLGRGVTARSLVLDLDGKGMLGEMRT